MQTLHAIINGKVVEYPVNTTFVIERRQPRRSYSLVASRHSLTEAVCKFNRSAQPGTITRLSCTIDGHVKPLVREIHK